MKKIYFITFILVLVLTGCEGNGPRGNVRLGDDLLPDYTITTMPPHSYAEFSGTYMESLISSGESYYSSLYESMYPTETDRWGGMKPVTGVSAQKVEAVTMPPNNDLVTVTSVCVRNPSDEEFERFLNDITTVTAVEMPPVVTTVVSEDNMTEITTDTTSVFETKATTKTKLVAVTADTAQKRTTTATENAE